MRDELPTIGLQGAAGVQGATGPRVERLEGSIQGLHYTHKLGNPVADLPISNRTWTDEHPREILIPQYDWQDAAVTVTGGGSAPVGAFYGKYTGDDGHTYLQGGTVTGGSMTTTIDDIKVVDDTTGIVSTEGFHLYIKCRGDGVVANGVLLGGWEMTTAAVTVMAADVPDNTLPTADSHEGKLFHVDLGVFTSTSFLPSESGNVNILFCPNGYNHPR